MGRLAGGYVRGKIVIVSNLANRMKSNATIDQIKSLARFYEQLEIGMRKE